MQIHATSMAASRAHASRCACGGQMHWPSLCGPLPPLRRGEVAESVEVTVCGHVLARRDHSATLAFIDVQLSSDCLQAGQLKSEALIETASVLDGAGAGVGACNSTAGSSVVTATDASPRSGEAVTLVVRLCMQIQGDASVRCHLCVLHQQPSENDKANHRGSDETLSLMVVRLELRQMCFEPERLLHLLADVKHGKWSAAEAAQLVGANERLLTALMPSLTPAIDKLVEKSSPLGENDVTCPNSAIELYPERLERVRQVARSRQAGLILVIEHIKHPTNLAAILRTCDAFGVAEVAVVQAPHSTRIELDSAALVHASSSASRWVKVVEYASTEACLQSLRARGYFSVGTALHAQRSTELHATSLLYPQLALWLGNEARGLCTHTLNALDALVHVQMDGFVESLNVAACAAVTLAEVRRQRHASGCDFAPTEEETVAVTAHLDAAARRRATMGIVHSDVQT